MNLKSPRLLALGLPLAALGQCAPQSCTPAPPPAPVETTTPLPAPVETIPPVVVPPPPAGNCHPDYVECLPIVADLDCGDIDPSLKPVHLYDANRDAYKLDGLNNAVGDGIGCEN